MPVSNTGQFALPVLRAGLVTLFLWFGLSQVTAPTDWVAWVPQWTESLGLSAATVVLLNGLFEVVLGVLLAAGFYTRIVALLLSLHLFFVAYEVGYNHIAARPFAVAGAT